MTTGPGYAATTLTSTPKSFSFFSIRREVNSSVSAEIVSCDVGAGSSSAIAGSVESPGRSVNSGCWRSFSARSDLAGVTTGGTIVTGSCSSMRTRSSSTLPSRLTAAASPSLRSRSASRRSFASVNALMIASPTRSATDSHEKRKYSDSPIASAISSASVPPVKPSACATPRATVSPTTPPGARGNCTFSDHIRSASMPSLASSTSTNAKPSASQPAGFSGSPGSASCRVMRR